ncbi:sulfatase-like hydrolase/transferase [Saccharobesus litoralis]|nr:sulfatase-like hydrolase/transferase [Saccharobesus litoralis]
MRILLSAFLCLFLLTACGGGGSSTSNNDNTQQEDNSGDGSGNGSGDSGSGDSGSGGTDNGGSENGGTNEVQPSQPNILVIISDDQGKDASAEYPNYTSDAPNTPNLSQLASQGIIFENAWASPACAPTRAALLTGLYAVNNGVPGVPGNLDENLATVASMLKSHSVSQDYQTGFFGKWHLSGGGNDMSRVNRMGFDHVAAMAGNVGDYYNWQLYTNGVETTSTQYNTSHLVDLTLNWLTTLDNSKPWLTWLAFAAPHSPFHLPPNDLHDRDLSGTSTDIDTNKRAYYLAAIEAMDKEIGRLLAGLSQAELDNTVIIYIGDNGSPKAVMDTTFFRKPQSKGTLYEGGVAVPMFISGVDVTRQGTRENALINSTDIYATVADLAGIPDSVSNSTTSDSFSFYELLSDSNAANRQILYTEINNDGVHGSAIRNSQYKLIVMQDGSEEFFDLISEPQELTNLLNESSFASSSAYNTYLSLKNQLAVIKKEQANTATDITDAIFTKRMAGCAEYVNTYTSNVQDVRNSTNYNGDLNITVSNGKCIFNTNAIPNHDFNDGSQSFPNQVSEQNDTFEVTTQPAFAGSTTALTLNYDNAILLNGVKVDLLAAGCFGIGNGKIGCNDVNQPWRYDPMFAANGFNVDSHHAHTQPDGTYHYHGTPNAFYEQDKVVVSPVVGFAADGFPIYGPYFDDNGTVRKATSSYQLKAGNRPSGSGEPGGTYDGAFRDDWQYVNGAGDLDECNGMTINGQYGYYITDTFPYILACFKGTVDESFNKRN